MSQRLQRAEASFARMRTVQYSVNCAGGGEGELAVQWLESSESRRGTARCRDTDPAEADGGQKFQTGRQEINHASRLAREGIC